MKLQSTDQDGVVIRVSWNELAIMNYSIRETVGQTDESEYPTLVGAPLAVAKSFADEILQALDLEPTKKSN